MTDFNLKKYWNDRYRDRKRYRAGDGSGIGSEGVELKVKGDFVNILIAGQKIKSIVDYGCGAGNFTGQLVGFEKYLGYDISDACISICVNKYRGVHGIEFTSAIENVKPEQYQLAISMDVLFHQVSETDFYRSLAELFRHEWVLIYTIDRQLQGMMAHMKIRVIDDIVKTLYKDYELLQKIPAENNKSFYLYKKIGK